MSQQPNDTDWSEKKVFTTGEAAGVCKVSQQTIIRCFDNGRLGGFRVPGSRFRRIPRTELLKFMVTNEIPTEILEPKQKRILVVDDDPGILEIFSEVFDSTAYNVKMCSTGYDAGLMTESFKPHLIILDYMLPDVNGNVVCERIRSHADMQNTRIVFVSGVVNQSEIDGLLAAGGDAFIRKPFDIDELLSRVEELLASATAG